MFNGERNEQRQAGEEKLTIIGIRAEACVKKALQDVATDRGETLSELIWKLLTAGWETVVEHEIQEDVKQEENEGR